MLFPLTDYDVEFYRSNIESFLPDNFIDVHSHIWKKEHRNPKPDIMNRNVACLSMVAAENPIEDGLKSRFQAIFLL